MGWNSDEQIDGGGLQWADSVVGGLACGWVGGSTGDERIDGGGF